MNLDPGIISYVHCRKSIYCYEVLNRCPLCGIRLSENDDLIPPVRIPFPFRRARDMKCAILLKATNGKFLTDYTIDANLHIGVTDSESRVAEYDESGVKICDPNWDQCVVAFQLKDIGWVEKWDSVIRNTANCGLFSQERYNERDFNCFSFVMEFLKNLQHPKLCVYLSSKVAFCDELILPVIKKVKDYIEIYSKIKEKGYCIAGADAAI